MTGLLLISDDKKEFELLTDSNSNKVWVNANDGSCVARFDVRFGMDIHNTLTDQMAGKPECLYCTHEKPTYKDWQDFVLKLREFYKVNISIDSIDVGLLS